MTDLASESVAQRLRTVMSPSGGTERSEGLR